MVYCENVLRFTSYVIYIFRTLIVCVRGYMESVSRHLTESGLNCDVMNDKSRDVFKVDIYTHRLTRSETGHSIFAFILFV